MARLGIGSLDDGQGNGNKVNKIALNSNDFGMVIY